MATLWAIVNTVANYWYWLYLVYHSIDTLDNTHHTHHQHTHTHHLLSFCTQSTRQQTFPNSDRVIIYNDIVTYCTGRALDAAPLSPQMPDITQHTKSHTIASLYLWNIDDVAEKTKLYKWYCCLHIVSFWHLLFSALFDNYFSICLQILIGDQFSYIRNLMASIKQTL